MKEKTFIIIIIIFNHESFREYDVRPQREIILLLRRCPAKMF